MKCLSRLSNLLGLTFMTSARPSLSFSSSLSRDDETLFTRRHSTPTIPKWRAQEKSDNGISFFLTFFFVHFFSGLDRLQNRYRYSNFMFLTHCQQKKNVYFSSSPLCDVISATVAGVMTITRWNSNVLVSSSKNSFWMFCFEWQHRAS